MKTSSILTGALFLAFGLLTFVAYHGYMAATAQRSFPTAEAGAQALLSAAEGNDLAALRAIFGSKGRQILESGDPVQDKNRRAMFVEAARKSMKLQPDPGPLPRVRILLGEDDFPFAVPLRRADGRWRFDVDAGKRELLARRIGGNEIDAIRLCTAYVAAQEQFAAEDHDRTGVHQYAMRFISSPGRKDGLYWSDVEGPQIAPLAEMVKEAAAEGYNTSGEKPVPYHGYNVQILTGQGRNAEGGATDYMVHGLLIGGFGLVSWPAEYGVSGIKTFLVNQAGVVYEKDLGPNSARLAKTMQTFNPDSTWTAVQ
jgi:hypothetical protein